MEKLTFEQLINSFNLNEIRDYEIQHRRDNNSLHLINSQLEQALNLINHAIDDYNTMITWNEENKDA